jgi:hypothetical protein
VALSNPNNLSPINNPRELEPIEKTNGACYHSSVLIEAPPNDVTDVAEKYLTFLKKGNTRPQNFMNTTWQGSGKNKRLSFLSRVRG